MKFGTLVIPVALAILISVFTFVSSIFYAAVQQDERALTSEQTLLSYELQQLHTSLETLASDNAWWDVAVEKLYLEEDIEWADETLGETTNSYKFMDGVTILRANGSLLYNSSTTDDWNIPDLSNQLGKIATRLSVKTENSMADYSGFLLSDERIVAFGISMIRPAQPDFPHSIPATMPVLIFYAEVTHERLSEIGQAKGISTLSIHKKMQPASVHPANIDIIDAHNTPIATLSWVPSQPGSELITTLLYPSILSLSLVVVAFVYFMLQATKTMKNLDIANKSKSSFLASMSHEIRTPLNSIIGFSQLLDMELYGKIEGAKNKEYLQVIKGSGEHLLSIINDILDLSKLEAGKYDVHLETLDPLDAIENCLDLMAVTMQGKDINITKSIETSSLITDGRMLRQILLNIVSNAMKFTRQGGLIDISGKKSKNHYVITITDTGIGMSEKQIEVALTPFGQVANEYARDHSGTGLGLPIVQRFMALLDGKMTLTSKLGTGTRVTLEFPLIARAKQMPDTTL